ncbi:hypothetical protein SNK03_005059 [Fusarium graminearum]|uniref:Chromosome 2, complete genome n=3 Tax=Gibberella zeae TaxID=5518 RepID=A0A098DFD5_GIBZE|nr:unnamed protein product [Fusarium graminearum]CAF3598993.1 unnamed protein product [Fusarium graminearum]CAF3662096.1 unnamed protein product [Fusarium graminearum]CAG1960780.1 unnamed protein product [Fusarium graminearum]CAG1974520.1 unnamed protein product [Fusarium graminearum]
MPVNHCHAAFLTNHYLNPNPSHLQTCSFLIITHQSNPHSQTLSNKPTPKQPTTITMESLKQGVNYVAETVQQAASGASKETNKQVAKDSNAPIGTRASAAKDALSDKADEKTHEGKASVHKEAI